jgi:hypothetical protein
MTCTLLRLRSRHSLNSLGVRAVVAASKAPDCRSASRYLTCNQGHLDSRFGLCTVGSPRAAESSLDRPGQLRRQRRWSLNLRPWSPPSQCRPIPSRQRRPGCRRCRQDRRPYRRSPRLLRPRGFPRCRHRQLPRRQPPRRRCRRFHPPNHRRRHHRCPTFPRFRPCPPCHRLAWRPMWTDHPSKSPRRWQWLWSICCSHCLRKPKGSPGGRRIETRLGISLPKCSEARPEKQNLWSRRAQVCDRALIGLACGAHAR